MGRRRPHGKRRTRPEAEDRAMSRLRRLLAGWAARILVALMLPARVDGLSIKADAGSTFDLLGDVLADKPIEPGDPRADPLTLVKITALLTFMLRPAEPAAVLRIVQERLAAAEDIAAIRYLFDAEGRPL
jgi:hypothetical protein